MFQYINDNRYRAIWPYKKLNKSDVIDELVIASRALKVNEQFIKDLDIVKIEKTVIDSEKYCKVIFQSDNKYSIATAALMLDGDIWDKVDPVTASKAEIKAAQHKVLDKISMK